MAVSMVRRYKLDMPLRGRRATYQATTPQARSTSATSTVATIEMTSDPKHPILFEYKPIMCPPR